MVFDQSGFTQDSRMYRGLSFAGIPSEPFLDLRSVQRIDKGVRFKQIVGARTQSAEMLREKVYPVSGVSLIARSAFPPIWTELELTIMVDGTWTGKLLRHSLFPSVSFYLLDPRIHSFDMDNGAYMAESGYDGVPNYDEWREHGWGSMLRNANERGPGRGNP
jgi:hypothetical protein